MAEEYVSIFNPDGSLRSLADEDYFAKTSAERLSNLLGGIDTSLDPSVQSLVDARRSGMQNLRSQRSEIDALRQDKMDDMARAFEISSRPVELDPRSPLRSPSDRQGLMYKEVKNPILRGLQTLTRNRLIQRGLLESPTDIASQDVARITQQNKLAETFRDSANYAEDQIEQLRQQAFRDVEANPALGIEDPEVAAAVLPEENLIDIAERQAGLDMNLKEKLEYDIALGDRRAANQLRTLYGDSNSQFFVNDPKKRAKVLSLNDEEFMNFVTEQKSTIAGEKAEAMGLPPGSVVQVDDLNGKVDKIYIPDLRDAQQIDRYGRILEDWESVANKEFAKQNVEWQQEGSIFALRDLADLDKAQNLLTDAADREAAFFTGPIVSQFPDYLRAMTEDGKQALDARAAIRNVVMKSLRAILGGQFAFLEGEKLVQNTYDETLPPEVNLARIRSLAKSIRDAYDNKAAMFAHLKKYRTLYGEGEKGYDPLYLSKAYGSNGLAEDILKSWQTDRDYSKFTLDEMEKLLLNNNDSSHRYFNTLDDADKRAIKSEFFRRKDWQ